MFRWPFGVSRPKTSIGCRPSMTILKSAMAQREFLHVTNLNTRFHRIIHEAVNNQFLISSFRNIDSQYQRLAYVCFSKDMHSNDLKRHFDNVIADHDALIECFMKRDETAAVEKITQHIHLFSSRVARQFYPSVPKFEGTDDQLMVGT